MLFKILYPDINDGLLFQELLAKAIMEVCLHKNTKEWIMSLGNNWFLQKPNL